MKLLLELALIHLKGRLRQTVLSVTGVAIGVGFSVALASLMQGSQQDFIERIVNSAPHVLIKDEFRHPRPQPVQRRYPGGAVQLTGTKPKDEMRGIRNPKPRVAALNRIPDVFAAPNLRGEVVMRYGGKDIAASLVGIEPKLERQVSDLETDMIEGSLKDLRTVANGIILGRGLARKLGVKKGSTLSVSSPAGVLLKMKVVGTYFTGIVTLDEARGYAILKKVQVLLDRPNVINEIRLRLAEPIKAEALARRIEAQMGYRAESWEEANQGVLEVFKIRNIIIYATVGSILAVAAFGIFNIISTIIFEKVRDIAILKSIGFLESDIRRLFLIEGVLMGTIGTLIGWILGYLLYRGLGTVRVEVALFTQWSRLLVIFSVYHYLIAAAAALIAASVAGYLPARKAAHLNPVDIIRGAT